MVLINTKLIELYLLLFLITIFKNSANRHVCDVLNCLRMIELILRCCLYVINCGIKNVIKQVVPQLVLPADVSSSTCKHQEIFCLIFHSSYQHFYKINLTLSWTGDCI